ncbi:uncharacterized protein LOC120229047 [Hyaena hyaena]|uniref:uncharacterized protein LOC120229047 n=1 Tax=Hyaena hyaena TaxID=95912 RepID=UPI001923B45D|nr:uncharacterized protein LOC120229047 [Hyaena hyaena]
MAEVVAGTPPKMTRDEARGLAEEREIGVGQAGAGRWLDWPGSCFLGQACLVPGSQLGRTLKTRRCNFQFADVETEAQRGYAACPRLHSRLVACSGLTISAPTALGLTRSFPFQEEFAQYDNTGEGKRIFKAAGIQCWEDLCFATKFQSFGLPWVCRTLGPFVYSAEAVRSRQVNGESGRVEVNTASWAHAGGTRQDITDGQQAYETMLHISDHQGNAYQNYSELSLYTCQNGQYQKDKK